MSPWRFVIPLGLLVALFWSPAADAFPAPQPRFAPFDLGYLPEYTGQGILAFRPAAICQHFPVARNVASEYQQMLNLLLGQALGGDLSAGPTPAFADLDQCVLGVSCVLTANIGTQKGSLKFGGGTPGVLRTVKPFDWSSAARKWFPAAVARSFLGKTYLRVSWRIPDAEGQYLAVLAPDDRTLVFGNEQDIRSMLRRLQHGKSAFVAPPGWRAVERNLVAFALDARRIPFIKGPWPAESDESEDLRALLEGTRVLTAGLSVGRRTNLQLALYTTDVAMATVVEGLVNRLLDTGKRSLKEELPDVPEVGMKLLTDALGSLRVERAGPIVLVRAGLGCNVLGKLADQVKKHDKEAERHTIHAGNFPTKPGTTWVYKCGDEPPCTQVLMKAEKKGEDTFLSMGIKGLVPGEEATEIATYRVTREALFTLMNVRDTYTPPKRELQFPLKIGQRWTGEYTIMGLPAKDTCTVSSLETVTVPAGTYKAMRILVTSSVGQRKAMAEVWFAPEVGMVKKQIGEAVWELQSFTPGN